MQAQRMQTANIRLETSMVTKMVKDWKNKNRRDLQSLPPGGSIQLQRALPELRRGAYPAALSKINFSWLMSNFLSEKYHGICLKNNHHQNAVSRLLNVQLVHF